MALLTLKKYKEHLANAKSYRTGDKLSEGTADLYFRHFKRFVGISNYDLKDEQERKQAEKIVEQFFDCTKEKVIEKINVRIFKRGSRVEQAALVHIIEIIATTEKERQAMLKRIGFIQKRQTSKSREVNRMLRNKEFSEQAEFFIERIKEKNNDGVIIDRNWETTKLAAKMLFDTGCRRNELLNIKVSELKIGDELTKIKIRGKGSKDREVFLSKRTTEEVLSFITNKGLEKDDYIIEYPNVKRKYQGYALWYRFKKHSEQLLEDNVNPHKFRHAVAILMVRGGADIKDIKENLGHSSTQTTEKYAQFSEERKEKTYKNYFNTRNN